VNSAIQSNPFHGSELIHITLLPPRTDSNPKIPISSAELQAALTEYYPLLDKETIMYTYHSLLQHALALGFKLIISASSFFPELIAAQKSNCKCSI
jgi:hypothetical protein